MKGKHPMQGEECANVSRLFYAAFKGPYEINHEKAADGRICRVCAAENVPQGYVIPKGSWPSKSFVDYPKFKRNDRDEVCVPCVVMIEEGLASWLIAGGKAEQVSTKMDVWRPVLLSPPEPPFVLAIQRTIGGGLANRKHVLLGGAVGLDKDYFPLNTQSGTVWVNRPFATAFVAEAERLIEHVKAKNKAPAFKLKDTILAMAAGEQFEDAVKKAFKAQTTNEVPLDGGTIEGLVKLSGGALTPVFAQLVIELVNIKKVQETNGD